MREEPSMTNSLFLETKEICPVCNAVLCLLPHLLLCPECGDYLVFDRQNREIKESRRICKK